MQGSAVCTGAGTPSNCPYNMFTSAPNDIRPNYASILQVLLTKKSGNIFRAGIFLDFV